MYDNLFLLLKNGSSRCSSHLRLVHGDLPEGNHISDVNNLILNRTIDDKVLEHLVSSHFGALVLS